MIHVRPSKELRSNYVKISELVKKGDRVVITVNGVGDGVFIGMDAFNEYEMLRAASPTMTPEQRRELTLDLKKALQYSDSADATFYSHQEVGHMLDLQEQ